MVYPSTNSVGWSPNLGFVACVLYCVACWAGLVYLIELAVG